MMKNIRNTEKQIIHDLEEIIDCYKDDPTGKLVESVLWVLIGAIQDGSIWEFSELCRSYSVNRLKDLRMIVEQKDENK